MVDESAASAGDVAATPGDHTDGNLKTDANANGSVVDDIVGGLGEALAGVTLNSVSRNFTPSGDPFSITNTSTDDGWGNFTDTGAVSTSFTGLENTSTGTDHVRNVSLDRFLSRSPSQTLGRDVFKLSHTNLPTLNQEANVNSDTSSAFRMPGQTLAPGTTSSSRSVSPYTSSSDNRTIQAYRYDPSSSTLTNTELQRNHSSFTDDGQSGHIPERNALYNGYPEGSVTQRSPFAKERNHIKPVGSGSGVYDPALYERSSSLTLVSQQQPQQKQQQPQQQSQVLYMAVPSPDGHGQVLQPVQMLQMPGKPYAYVMPGANSCGPQGIIGNSQQQQQQPLMMLPPNNEYEARSPVPRMGSNYGLESSRIDSPYERDDFAGSVSSNGNFAGDAALASLYSAPQRPSLEELLGQVRRLSRDQVGCRLVQQALDEEGPMAATLIMNEGLPFWGEAMVDPFGNYLFQKILEKVTVQERVVLVRSVSSRLVNASLNLHGTRSVQKVVEMCAQDEQHKTSFSEESAADILTHSLVPAAARLCIDSHGNHVIQRILLKLSYKHSVFVFNAVANNVGDVARHRHGCCVIQRCLDSPPSEARAHLVRRIVEKSLELMQDAYGNYVVQYVLDVCSDQDVHAVCESVAGKVCLLAIQKFSSNVMEKCLERCSDRVRELYLAEISDSERIRELMMDPFGNYVVQRALSVSTHAQAVRLVEAMRPHLIATQTSGPNGQRNGGVRNTAGGRRIIAKICRRFPNFTLNGIGNHDELYSQNKRNYRQQGHTPIGNYPPVGTPHGHGGSHYMHDPRMAQSHMEAQQQSQHQHSFYSVRGGPYYDHFSNGHGDYGGL